MCNHTEGYLRYECVNFDCQVNPRGYFVISPLDGAEDETPPLCQFCHAPMIREDVMATNTLLWELGIEVIE